MIISRRLAWVTLIAAIVTAGVLRQFHAAIPAASFLPAPVGSLLFVLVLILGVLFARTWGQRQEIPYAGPDLARVNLLALVPLLIALMLEKWISITFYERAFTWINGTKLSATAWSRLFVLESAIGLGVVCLFLLPMFRRLFPLLGRALALRRIPAALLGLGAALVCLYGGLALLFRLTAPGDVALQWSGFGRTGGLLLLGQAAIAITEEIYYRGILQTELAFLLPAMGVVRERVRIMAAIALISIAFALEHVVPTGDPVQDGRRALFAFSCSLLLGMLLLVRGNLWLCAGCHCAINLLALTSDPRHGGLRFVDGTGRPLLAPQVYIVLLFVLIFVALYAREALSRFLPGKKAEPRPTMA